MQLVDIGINLTNNSFTDDLDDVIQQANAVGVTKLVITGTSEAESEQGLALAKHYNQFCTAGVHPHDAKDVSENFTEHLKSLASHQQVVAIGECGLDFNRNYSPADIQQSVFHQQIALAKELNMPLFLHERDAFETQQAILQEHQVSHAVAHCFTGNKAQMRAWLDMGFYIGVTGWLCDERRADDLRDAVRYLPLDRLMLETDGPYLLPRTLKRKSRRNVPANLPHIAEQLAALLEIDVQLLAEHSYRNSVRFFVIE